MLWRIAHLLAAVRCLLFRSAKAQVRDGHTDGISPTAQIWRLVTPFFFYGGLGFPFLVNMLFLYQYSRLLEEETFSGKRAEYVFMLLVCAAVLLPVGVFWPFHVLSISLLLAIVYVWANLNKERIVSFFFGLRFKVRSWTVLCRPCWIVEGVGACALDFPLSVLMYLRHLCVGSIG